MNDTITVKLTHDEIALTIAALEWLHRGGQTTTGDVAYLERLKLIHKQATAQSSLRPIEAQ